MRVERLRQEFSIDIVYRHFPLHPETPDEGLTLEQLFAGRNFDIAAAQARLSQLISEEGLPYGPRTMTYNSRFAQELGSWAETQPMGEHIHKALFQAYFVNNINLARIDNLVTIAAEIGMRSDEARSALEHRHYREMVDSDWRRSHELGITGVPTFVLGNQALVGAQSFSHLEQFLAKNDVPRHNSSQR